MGELLKVEIVGELLVLKCAVAAWVAESERVGYRGLCVSAELQQGALKGFAFT